MTRPPTGITPGWGLSEPTRHVLVLNTTVYIAPLISTLRRWGNRHLSNGRPEKIPSPIDFFDGFQFDNPINAEIIAIQYLVLSQISWFPLKKFPGVPSDPLGMATKRQ
jgi:hypothetical protein